VIALSMRPERSEAKRIKEALAKGAGPTAFTCRRQFAHRLDPLGLAKKALGRRDAQGEGMIFLPTGLQRARHASAKQGDAAGRNCYGFAATPPSSMSIKSPNGKMKLKRELKPGLVQHLRMSGCPRKCSSIQSEHHKVR